MPTPRQFDEPVKPAGAFSDHKPFHDCCYFSKRAVYCDVAKLSRALQDISITKFGFENAYSNFPRFSTCTLRVVALHAIHACPYCARSGGFRCATRNFRNKASNFDECAHCPRRVCHGKRKREIAASDDPPLPPFMQT